MKKNTLKSTIAIICLVVVVVACFAYLANRGSRLPEEDEVDLTQKDRILSRDLELDYPGTPKEVLKYYNEIIRCVYNDNNSEEDMEALVRQMRKLFDPELNDHNRWNEHLEKLRQEVERFKLANRRISSAGTASSLDVKIFESNSFTFARILGTYSVKDSDLTHLVRQVFLMRKDADSRWKIYGWALAENLNLDDSGS